MRYEGIDRLHHVCHYPEFDGQLAIRKSVYNMHRQFLYTHYYIVDKKYLKNQSVKGTLVRITFVNNCICNMCKGFKSNTTRFTDLRKRKG